MKANELRIGNYLDFDGMIAVVKEIDEQGVVVYIQETKETEWIDLFQFTEIQLTEEWLLRLDFKKADEADSFGGYLSPEMPNLSKIRIKNNEWSGQHCSVKIEYVHQLQNLYYALTQKELFSKSI